MLLQRSALIQGPFETYGDAIANCAQRCRYINTADVLSVIMKLHNHMCMTHLRHSNASMLTYMNCALKLDSINQVKTNAPAKIRDKENPK